MTVFVTFLHVKSIIIIIIFINISTFGSKTTKMCHSSEGLGLSYTYLEVPVLCFIN